ncbi:MAG: hypothetical protein ABI813_07060 [Bacteroidota bacterium]
MDELKLKKWREDFSLEVEQLRMEFDAFFFNRKLEDFYELKVDTESQNLSLEITNKEKLPKEIEKRLMEILYSTQPEDSV